MDIDKIEAELAAVKAERERKAQERDAAARGKRAAAALARERQRMADDELFAQLSEQHERVGRVNTPDGMVVVKAPQSIVYNRFRDEVAATEHPNPKQRKSFSVACDNLALLCVVHPDRAAYSALADKFATLTTAVANMAIELGKAQAEAEEGE